MTAPTFSTVVKNSSDLITEHTATVNGFINQAKAKIEAASKFVKEANSIREALKKCETLEDILKHPDLKNAILFAGGFSTKSQKHIPDKDLDEIAKSTLTTLQNSCEDLKSEILYRFLLTAGDSLGGSMRNLTGSLAQRIVLKYILNSLVSKGIKCGVIRNPKGKVQAIHWKDRVMIFDKTPKFINKNIDLILLSGNISDLIKRNLIESKENYVSLGEIKGGIDPAGADEHWKTASKALERIRTAFSDTECPKLFFLGAAIEESMAEEIYSDVKSGKLEFAANLNSQKQTKALTDWLVSI